MSSSSGRPLLSLLFAIIFIIASVSLLCTASCLAFLHWFGFTATGIGTSFGAALFFVLPAAFFCARLLRSLENNLFNLEQALDEVAQGKGKVAPPSDLPSENLAAAFLRLSDRVNSTLDKNHSDFQQLSSVNQQLKLAQQSKNQFVANMSHEIRTPLNGIIGTADLLLQNRLPSDQEHLIQVIRNAGEDLLIIVNDILDLSKLEHGHLKVSNKAFDLCSLVDDVVLLLAPGASEKHIPIETEFEPGADGIYVGDPVRLRQILINLLANAIKFTERGWVKLSIRVQPEESSCCRLYFAIQDTGIGIAAQDIARLFLPFSQIDNATTRHYEGAGLGLAICKRLVELMDGRIWVESKEGIGSTFHFSIKVQTTADTLGINAPANLPQLHPVHDPKRTTRARVHRKTSSLKLIDNMAREHPLEILLAEDNPVNMQVALGLLSVLGYQPDTATTGTEVLTALSRKYYDVILLDIQMPEMDGVEATRRIRQANSDPIHPYIVAVTANALYDNEEACREVGINDYITKPLRGIALQFALKRAIDVLRPAAAAEPKTTSGRIDREQVRELLGHENDDILQIFNLFIQDTRSKLGQLAAYEAAGDYQKLGKLAHQLKGGASNFGLISFCTLMAELESSTPENASAVSERVEQASPMFEKSLQALASHAPDLFKN